MSSCKVAQGVLEVYPFYSRTSGVKYIKVRGASSNLNHVVTVRISPATLLRPPDSLKLLKGIIPAFSWQQLAREKYGFGASYLVIWSSW